MTVSGFNLISRNSFAAIRVFALLFLGLFLVFPVVTILISAVHDEQGYTLKYIASFIGSPDIVRMTVRSLNAALLASILALLIALPLSLLGAFFQFRSRWLLQLLFVAPLVVPPFVSALGFRKLFARFGPVNMILMHLGFTIEPIDLLGQGSLVGVAIVQALHLFPIIALSCNAALMSFDAALLEAAALSGLNSFKLGRKILLPLLLPSIVAGTSIAFVWAITDVGTPLIFDYRDTLAVHVFNSVGEIHTNPVGYVSVLFLMIVSVLGFVVARKFQRSATVTGMRTTRPIARRQLGRVPALLIEAFLLIVATLSLLPHMIVLLLSITSHWFMTIIPQSITLQHYLDAFTHPLTLRSIVNSFGLSLVSTLIDLVLGVAIAVALVRSRHFLNSWLEVLALTPLAVPGIVVAFGYLGAFSSTLLDPRTWPLVILALGYSVRRLPFMLRTSRAGLEQTPLVYEEAAASVGAGPALTLRRITLPVLRPHLVAGAVLCFTFAMLEVSESLILAQQERSFPLTKAMYAVLGRPDGPYLSAALGVIGMLVLAGGLLLARKLLGDKFGEAFRA